MAALRSCIFTTNSTYLHRLAVLLFLLVPPATTWRRYLPLSSTYYQSFAALTTPHAQGLEAASRAHTHTHIPVVRRLAHHHVPCLLHPQRDPFLPNLNLFGLWNNPKPKPGHCAGRCLGGFISPSLLGPPKAGRNINLHTV